MKNQDNYTKFMKAALKEAQKALKAGEFPVGCVMVYENKVLVTGSRQGTVESVNNELDHAEIVALRRLTKLETDIKIDRSKISLFCTMEPCLMCFGALLINHIKHIIYAYEDAMGGGTACDLKSMPPLYSNQDIIIVPHILRKESLKLFKDYFSCPENNYLTESFLAEYTLNTN
ncbi:Nucleoside deaminase [Candidatus Magnetomoraceae bacterium gMMP-15]